MSGLLSNLRDFGQGASNAAASAVSGPVDLLAMLLRKAGVPVPNNAVGGSEWMAQQGLTAQPMNRTAGLLGEAAGLISPIAVQAKAPQIARGLLQMGDNIASQSSRNLNQRGMIDIEFRKSDLGKKARLEDGRLIVEWPGIGASPSELADFAREQAAKIASPKYDHFFRFTNNKDEVALALSKSLRPSRNHLENFVEAGLSVADGPHYSTAGYKFGYPLKGRVIGVGSDGEPLLDVMTLDPLVRNVMPSQEIARAGWAAQREQLQRLGLPVDWLDHRFRFLNDPYTFRPK